jgi:hypothetical protein
MHNTTNDPQQSINITITTIDHQKIRTQDHALQHHCPSKRKIPTQDHALPGMHYTTIMKAVTFFRWISYAYYA